MIWCLTGMLMLFVTRRGAGAGGGGAGSGADESADWFFFGFLLFPFLTMKS
jgi:hypothetical protein